MPRGIIPTGLKNSSNAHSSAVSEEELPLLRQGDVLPVRGRFG